MYVHSMQSGSPTPFMPWIKIATLLPSPAGQTLLDANFIIPQVQYFPRAW